VRRTPGEQSPMIAPEVSPLPTRESGIGSRELEMPAHRELEMPAHCPLPTRKNTGVQWCTDAGISSKKCHLVPLFEASKSTLFSPIERRKSFQNHHLEFLLIHPSTSKTRRAQLGPKVPHQRSPIVHYGEPATKGVGCERPNTNCQVPNTEMPGTKH
jgi:hypothetical protein